MSGLTCPTWAPPPRRAPRAPNPRKAPKGQQYKGKAKCIQAQPNLRVLPLLLRQLPRSSHQRSNPTVPNESLAVQGLQHQHYNSGMSPGISIRERKKVTRLCVMWCTLTSPRSPSQTVPEQPSRCTKGCANPNPPPCPIHSV